MLSGIRLQNFKSFVDAEARIGGFCLLVGTNAAGKSNLLDAIRILQGIGLGYSLGEILSGRYEGGVPVWKGIRGAAAAIAGDPDERVTITTDWLLAEEQLRHTLRLDLSDEPRIAGESLWWNGQYLFDTHAASLGQQAGPQAGGAINVAFKRAPGGSGGRSPSMALSADRSILSRKLIFKNVHEKVTYFSDLLRSKVADALFLDLQPALMREFKSKNIRHLGANGENVSSVLFNLCIDPETRTSVVDWLAELCAPEIENIDFVVTEFDQVMLVLVERGGRRVSAQSISDGTLRFLGLLAALLTATEDSLILVEELENGLHPSRQHLLVEAIQSHVETRRIQFIASTHSPVLLSNLPEAVIGNVVMFGRPEPGGASVMKNISDLPHIENALKKERIDDLFTSLWLERAL